MIMILYQRLRFVCHQPVNHDSTVISSIENITIMVNSSNRFMCGLQGVTIKQSYTMICCFTRNRLESKRSVYVSFISVNNKTWNWFYWITL